MPDTSDSSDSEDDIQMQQFREAADPLLLTNAMFETKRTEHKIENVKQKPKIEEAKILAENVHVKESTEPKTPAISQRYLPEETPDNGMDLQFSDAVQKHVFKKLQEVIQQQVEFCDIPKTTQTKQKPSKSKVKLLKDADCYVQFYDEIVDTTIVPQKKPKIKKRRISNDTAEMNEEEKVKLVSVAGESILQGVELKHWHKKRDRPDAVYHYKYKRGKLQEKPSENEFTALRIKNKWNEDKIRERNK